MPRFAYTPRKRPSTSSLDSPIAVWVRRRAMRDHAHDDEMRELHRLREPRF
jgi:hypothetical protein